MLSINETNQNYQFRSVGTYAHGSFKDVDEDQIEVLSAHPKVKTVGRRTVIGLCTSGVFAKDYGEVGFMDDNTAQWGYAQPEVGRAPQSGKEITMDTKALALLGVTPKLGAQVTLTYTLADKEQIGRDVTDTFTLVGWWEYDELLAVHFFNVSEEYARQIEAMAMYGRNETAHDVYYTVCAWVEVPYDMGSRFYAMGYQAVLSVDTLRRDVGEENVVPMLYLFDTPNPEAEAAAERYLAELTAMDTSPLMYESKATHRAHYRYTITPVLLMIPIFLLLGYAIPAMMYRHAAKQSVVERLREAEA